jgi:parallel beta-helix repeat protein
MTDLGLQTFNKLYPMMIRKYQDLIVDQNADERDKINQIIQKLNALGKLSNDVVRDWNTVYQWTMNDGLTQAVDNKLEAMKSDGEISTLLQNIYNSLVGDMTTLHTTAKDTFVNVINEVDDLAKSNAVSLTQITSQTLLISSFSRQSSETDDTGLIQRALNGIGSNGRLIFPPNKQYTVGLLTLPISINNLTIEGNGSTLISNISVNANGASGDPLQFTVLKDTVNQIKNNIVPTVDITQGNTTLTFNSTDISGVQVGDMVVVKTTKSNALNSVYKLGSYRYVKVVSSTQLTLDDEIENSLSISTDSVTVSIYRPINNLKINNLNFQLVNNGFQAGIWLQHVNGFTLNDCNFIGGGQQFWGVNANGFNIRITNQTCTEFLDNSLSFGYGAVVSGHNIRVNNGTYYKCKHGIAAGASAYLNTDIGYFHNYATDPQLVAFDAHGSCEQVKMINNTVVNVGKSFAGGGLWARGNNFEINGNTVKASSTKSNTVSGLKINDVAYKNVSFIANKVYGCDYGIKMDEVNSDLYDFIIEENWLSNILSHGMKISKLHDSVITKNRITSNGQGIYAQGVDNVDIEGNIIKYGATTFGAGVYLDTRVAGDANPYKNITIRGNHIANLSSSGTSPVRVRDGGYDILTLVNNIVDNTANAGAVPISLSECTTLTKVIREKNIGETYYTALPSATAFDRNRTIIVQGATGVADKTYICMKSSADTYSWVQVSTG